MSLPEVLEVLPEALEVVSTDAGDGAWGRTLGDLVRRPAGPSWGAVRSSVPVESVRFLLTGPFHHVHPNRVRPGRTGPSGATRVESAPPGQAGPDRPTSSEEITVPEGHVIHRLARQIDRTFGGRPVGVTSPQGRFAVEAAALDGATLSGAQAWGKNLLLDFDAPGPHLVHIHLGLIGKFAVGPSVPVTGQVRLRLSDAAHVADLRGPQTCDLVDEDRWRQVVDALGPDPIRPDADPALAWQKVHRSSKSIAELLMDQRIFAGVGNIYRAEVLFRHRIDPGTPGRDLKASTFSAIWDDLVLLMADGVDAGRIDTVRAEHTPEAMGRPPRVDAHGGEVYVYRREGQPCLVCGTPVQRRNLAGRHLFWCPRCQRRHH